MYVKYILYISFIYVKETDAASRSQDYKWNLLLHTLLLFQSFSFVIIKGI